jgi:hypothetical protein
MTGHAVGTRVPPNIKLHNKELRNFYSSPSIIKIMKSRRMRLVGHVARIWRRGTHIGIDGKAIEKEPLGKPRHRWVQN